MGNPFLRSFLRPVTFTPVIKSLAVELSQPGLNIFSGIQTLHSTKCATLKAEWSGSSAVHNIMSCHYNAYLSVQRPEGGIVAHSDNYYYIN